ncbi:hypothetical protein AB0368_04785 [Actinoplanes sp. NPDC051475]|uniref:hypothetical protein n=1 Tax=Actinoplanes sp. NPDC051475 TaxID=3157225 RepID=UPI00344C3E4C
MSQDTTGANEADIDKADGTSAPARKAGLWLTIAAGAVGLGSTLLAGRPVSTTMIAVVLVLAGPAWLLRRNLKKLAGEPRARKMAAWAATTVVAIGVTATAAVPTARSLVVHDLLGWPDNATEIAAVVAVNIEPRVDPSPSTRGSQLGIAPRGSASFAPAQPILLNKFRSVLSTVDNQSDRRQVVRTIEVSFKAFEDEITYLSEGPEYDYIIEGQQVGIATETTRRFEGAAHEDISSDSAGKSRAWPVRGEIHGSLGSGATINLTLSTAVHLEPRSLTTIELTIGRSVFNIGGLACDDTSGLGAGAAADFLHANVYSASPYELSAICPTEKGVRFRWIVPASVNVRMTLSNGTRIARHA